MPTDTLLTPTIDTAAPGHATERILGLACRNCGHAQPLGANYVCPACFGPLDVDYDLSGVRASLDKATIAARAPGIWRYLELLPVSAAPLRGLPVGSTPLLAADRIGPALGIDRLWIKDDTRNPTLSFKDRAVAIAAARAVEFGITTLACASTGNLAGATAAAAAVLGLPAYVFIPSDLEPAKVDHAPTRRAGASSTSTSARSMPRAARPSPSRSPSRSAGGARTSSSPRSRRVPCSRSSLAGSNSWSRSV